MRQVGISKHAVKRRRLAVDEVRLHGVRIRAQNSCSVDPVVADPFSDTETLFCERGGRLENLLECQSTCPLEQSIPGIYRTRHGCGVDSVQRHASVLCTRGEVLQGRSGGCTAAAVQRDQFLLLGNPRDYEHVTTDTGTFGLDDIEHGGGGHRCIECITTSFKNAQSRL
jgi:hypothetical protein